MVRLCLIKSLDHLITGHMDNRIACVLCMYDVILAQPIASHVGPSEVISVDRSAALGSFSLRNDEERQGRTEKQKIKVTIRKQG